MLYRFLKALLKITNKFYFRTFQVKGLENIPKTGPVFFVANHPGAFLDPIVVALSVDRELSFLAKGSLFKNGFLKWLLPKFNMIPIYRSQDAPQLMSKNKEAFEHCYRHFERGGAMLIFPEGISETDRKIKEIKTGTARICLGAEAENNFGLGIKIVTLGLNYSDPHSFQSNLFVTIDEAIEVANYTELYKSNSSQAVRDLTEEIRLRLEKQVVAIQDSDLDAFVADLELIYKSQLLKELGYSRKEMEQDFNTTKAIRDSLYYFMEKDPERVTHVKNLVTNYLNDLEALSLNDRIIKRSRKSKPLWDAFKAALYLIVGFPVFIFGFINNFLPFKIPGWSAQFISKSNVFEGAIAFSFGTFTFLIFYSLQLWLLHKLTHDWILLLLYLLLLPMSGLFAFYYYKRFTTIRGNWKFFSLFYKQNSLASSLIEKRQTLMEHLEKARKDFQSFVESSQDPNLNVLKSNPEDLNQFFNLNS